MPVKGANQIKARLRQQISATQKTAYQYVNAVVSEAGALSKTKAPIEFGTLHNSQAIDVRQTGALTIGTLSYNTAYAAILNNGVYKWNPRPPSNKAGPAWNPDAEPHFLEYGFESKESVAVQQRLMEMFRI